MIATLLIDVVVGSRMRRQSGRNIWGIGQGIAVGIGTALALLVIIGLVVYCCLKRIGNTTLNLPELLDGILVPDAQSWCYQK